VILALVLAGTTAVAQGSFGVLHSFTGAANDGAIPEGTPLLIGSSLYGVTYLGGSNSEGTVFQVTTNGTGFNLVYSFTGGTNGANPYGSLVSDGSTLYGMTFNGGVKDGGVLFGVNTNGVNYMVLHAFLGGNSDGLFPYGSPILDRSTLYGMTSFGGTNDFGVVFKISTNGSNFAVLHSFAGGTGDGLFPAEGVIVGGTNLYGTTFYGGSNNLGVVFAVSTNGGSIKILHHFAGGTTDGANPAGPLTLDGSNLYGLTTYGGIVNSGVVFKVSTSGTGFAVVHQFGSGTNDGASPQFGPLVVTNSLIYGAAELGGVSNRGALFQMATDGTGFTILHSFSTNANDGAFPFWGPILIGSTLYGATVNGGSNNLGVVYGDPATSTTATATCMCTNVPGAASSGVAIGNVVAGQAYAYAASGCVRTSIEPNFADPDGNESTNGCISFYKKELAPSGTCPGLNLFALVGKINGGSCFQLGKSGSFVATASGPLVLYCNDNNYGDNSGSYNVCIAPVQQMCTNIPSADPAGVVIGNVVAGQAYAYTASGCVQRSVELNFADPDGNQYTNGCTTFVTNTIAPIPYTCPGLSRFALVGKINGGSCFQLGKSGSFVATASGPLVLYFNDDNYGDNSGFYSVCITPTTLTQVSAIQIVGTNIVITVPTVVCMMYQLQYSNEMVPTNWINIVGASQAGTGLPIQLIDVGGAPQTGCVAVPGSAGGGVTCGSVVAGQTYGYQATGCIAYNTDGTGFSHPDGLASTNGCDQPFFMSLGTADGTFICPGLVKVSLVGKIGGTCIQLGPSGSFVAPASGTLVLYFNDFNFGDNSGSFSVCITSPIHRFYRVDEFP
jgi:uncharacterized repeat protein (TIGR03803 family)